MRPANGLAICFSLLVGLYYLFFLTDATAATAMTDHGDISQTHTVFTEFLKSIASHVNNLLASESNAGKFVNAEFITFATYRLTLVVAGYAFDVANLPDVFSVIMLIAIVQILMSFYGVLTSGLLQWSQDLGDVIQMEVLGNTSPFFAPEFMSAMMAKLTFTSLNSVSMTSFVTGIGTALATSLIGMMILVVVNMTMWVLSLVTFIGIAWSIWGFALAKLIGWFFIPFMLIERLAPLFDGWLKFMIGFLFYAVVIRVNTALVCILFVTYFGLGTEALLMDTATIPTITMAVNGFENVAGFLALMLVSILAILSTGGFATALAGGVGGFGGAVRSAAVMAGGGAAAVASLGKK